MIVANSKQLTFLMFSSTLSHYGNALFKTNMLIFCAHISSQWVLGITHGVSAVFIPMFVLNTVEHLRQIEALLVINNSEFLFILSL